MQDASKDPFKKPSYDTSNNLLNQQTLPSSGQSEAPLGTRLIGISLGIFMFGLIIVCVMISIMATKHAADVLLQPEDENDTATSTPAKGNTTPAPTKNDTSFANLPELSYGKITIGYKDKYMHVSETFEDTMRSANSSFILYEHTLGASHSYDNRISDIDHYLSTIQKNDLNEAIVLENINGSPEPVISIASTPYMHYAHDDSKFSYVRIDCADESLSFSLEDKILQCDIPMVDTIKKSMPPLSSNESASYYSTIQKGYVIEFRFDEKGKIESVTVFDNK